MENPRYPQNLIAGIRRSREADARARRLVKRDRRIRTTRHRVVAPHRGSGLVAVFARYLPARG